MKKTMFIMAIIMVIVLAIALTTSSLAWFSAAGASKVSLTSFTINAQSKTSEGLLIAKSVGAWSTSDLLLASESPVCKPVVPNIGANEEFTAVNALKALATETFIGNETKVEGGELYWADSLYSAGSWYSDDFYIANAGDKAVHIQADIKFSDRHGATLFAAVMAQKEDESWELIRLEKSTSNDGVVVTSLEVGKGPDFFAEDELVSAAYAGINPGALEQTSEALAAKAVDAAWGGYKHFKLIAWYAADLYNGNSGAYNATTNANGSSCNISVEFTIPTADQLGV